MYARKQILPNNSYSHVFFRCHNRQFLLKDDHVKDYLLLQWSKYKKRYQIEIYEFIIMDNHAHLLVRAKSTEALGHFMRTVNSLLARYINRSLARDSQAIRERYKSPLVTSMRYCHKLMQYIWLNRHKTNPQHNPMRDRYCSASWRTNPAILNSFQMKNEDIEIIRSLLDMDEHIYPEKIGRFVRDLLNAALGNASSGIFKDMIHGHTIGDTNAVSFRSELLNSFRRQKNPRPSWC